MEILAAFLMTWIADHSDYQTRDMPLPAIVELAPEELTRQAYSDQPELIPADGIDERVFAMYVFEDGDHGTVYVLGRRWVDGRMIHQGKVGSPAFQERLLHELVHHVQHMSGAYDRFPCRNHGEREAYLLGGKFLASQRVHDPLPYRVVMANRRSQCG